MSISPLSLIEKNALFIDLQRYLELKCTLRRLQAMQTTPLSKNPTLLQLVLIREKLNNPGRYSTSGYNKSTIFETTPVGLEID